MEPQFDILPFNSVSGDKALDIFENDQILNASLTDFAVLLGASSSKSSDSSDDYGTWMTSTLNGDGDYLAIGAFGKESCSTTRRDIGCRPSIFVPDAFSFAEKERFNHKLGVMEVESGEYPQYVIDEETSENLERLYNSHKDEYKTGRYFTTDSAHTYEDHIEFSPRKHEEYDFDGVKCIRIVGSSDTRGEYLTDGRQIVPGKPYWVAVEPIKWLLDLKSHVAISWDILFAGVQFDLSRHEDTTYDTSDIKHFLDNYFSKEIYNHKKSLDKIDLDFLTRKQAVDDKIFGSASTTSAYSDLAVLTGGFFNASATRGYFWSKDILSSNVCAICIGDYPLNSFLRDIGIRPVVKYSSIEPFITSDSGFYNLDDDGNMIVRFGEYPQTVPSPSTQDLLNKLYENYENPDLSLVFNKTGRKFTFDSTPISLINCFNPIAYEEFSLAMHGQKYVRVKCNSMFKNPFSDRGFSCKNGDYVWVQVEPVEWLVNKKEELAVSKNILLSGIQFDKDTFYGKDFNETIIKQFVDNYMSRELIGKPALEMNIVEEVQEERVERKTRLQKLNPDSSASVDRKKMTDTEVINSWIESGHSVLLRGPSGIGKTERIRALYPNLIYVKLTNNMFPEKIVGSMNLQTGQSIPPDYAKQALMLCATDEERELVSENIQNLYSLADQIYERSKNSDEKVVILLDELLNVKPAVQSLVYTLVLNKIVESGNGLKLPANTVVVATGNQKKYSSVAEDLAEPLEKRFDHILDMQPKVGEWIYEYAIPNKIHPAIVGYILSNYLQNKRSEEIGKMGYFYEEPEVGEKSLDKYGCKGRTNDPRGWVSVSNTLYSFEEELKKGRFIGKDVKDLLEVSIKSKLREEWADSFIDYYNIPVLSVEEVIEEKYSNADLPGDINERFACVMSLLTADDSQVEKCRSFIRKYCDPEYLSLYDMCWVGNDENRMIKIAELQEMEKTNRENADLKK